MTKIHRLLGSLAIALLVAGCGGEKDEGSKGDGHEAAAGVSEHSSAGLPEGNIAAGEKLASAKGSTGQACVDCHGPEGARPIDPSYPKLAGQHQDYLAMTLQMYRDERRNNPLMSAQAKPLTDAQIADLSAYFGSRPRHVRDLSEPVQ